MKKGKILEKAFKKNSVNVFFLRKWTPNNF
jgi:hypothetical protein